MIGGKYFGIAGALAAVCGLISGPLVVVLFLAILFGGVADNPVAQGALKGMGAVSAGLVIATGLKLGTTLPKIQWDFGQPLRLLPFHLRV
jgi:chromate transporter